jgi:ribosomal protein S18 acetylase RimI-like enzyme
MLELWKAYGRAPGRELHEGDELVRVLTGVPSALFNGVFHACLASRRIEQAIQETLAVCARWNVPLFWWVGSDTQPPDLGTHLEHSGFVHAGAAPGMALDLYSLPQDMPWPPGFTSELVEDKETLRTWACVTAKGTQFPLPVQEALVALECDVGLCPQLSLRRYIGYREGVPVATSELVLCSGVAGIYAVATLPEARRQGIGAAMTRIPVLHARAEGYRVGTLQSSEMGYSLYRRLGFRDVGKTDVYLIEPEKARQWDS